MRNWTRADHGAALGRRFTRLGCVLAFAWATCVQLSAQQRDPAGSRRLPASPPAATRPNQPARLFEKAPLNAPETASLPPAGVLRLRPEVRVRGTVATLGDVLDLSQFDAEFRDRIAREPVDSGLLPPANTVLSHAKIVQRLDELGVNLSRCLLVGALECRLVLELPPDAAAVGGALVVRAPQAAAEAPLMREPLARSAESRINPRRESAEGNDQLSAIPIASQTLAEAIRRQVTREFAALNGAVEIEFERGGTDLLQLSTPNYEFRISKENRDSGRLGLREFAVAILREGRTQRTVDIQANVKLVLKVAAAKNPLNLGAFVKRDDLEMQSRVFSNNDEIGITNIERLIGQQVRRFVAAGEIVHTSDVKPVDLVQRSKPVTVVSNAGGVQMRLSGIALDSGGYGESIRVRIGEARNQTREVRCTVMGQGKVQLTEEE